MNVENSLNWKNFLVRKGYSRSELARVLGVAPPMVTEWINGKSNPGYKYIKKLHEIGMTEEEIFCDTESDVGASKQKQANFDCGVFLKRKGLKQQEAADMLGVTQATISNWCKGKTPDYGTVVQLIRLGMGAEELFGKELAKILKSNDIEASGNFDAGVFESKVEKIVLKMKERGII